jgi:hypothetical protein
MCVTTRIISRRLVAVLAHPDFEIVHHWTSLV